MKVAIGFITNNVLEKIEIIAFCIGLNIATEHKPKIDLGNKLMRFIDLEMIS